MSTHTINDTPIYTHSTMYDTLMYTHIISDIRTHNSWHLWHITYTHRHHQQHTYKHTPSMTPKCTCTQHTHVYSSVCVCVHVCVCVRLCGVASVRECVTQKRTSWLQSYCTIQNYSKWIQWWHTCVKGCVHFVIWICIVSLHTLGFVMYFFCVNKQRHVLKWSILYVMYACLCTNRHAWKSVSVVKTNTGAVWSPRTAPVLAAAGCRVFLPPPSPSPPGFPVAPLTSPFQSSGGHMGSSSTGGKTPALHASSMLEWKDNCFGWCPKWTQTWQLPRH